MKKGSFAEVQTPLEDKLLLREMRGVEELGRPFSYQLELLSKDEKIKADALLGEGVTIKIALENDGAERCIHGLCTSFAATGRVGQYALYEAELHPWIWLLSHTSDCRIFQKQNIPDIIKTVFRDHGFSDMEANLQETYAELEYVVQYRETALNFVTRLMERAGIYYFFKHEDGKHTLVLADSKTPHSELPGNGPVPYYPAQARHGREHDYFDEWRVTERFRSGLYALNDYDFKNPNADLHAKSIRQRGYSHSDLELYDYPGAYEKTPDGEAIAKVRMQAHQARYEEIAAEGNVRSLSAGNLFKLEKFKQRPDQEREYLVVSVKSGLSVKGYESGTGSGSSYRASVMAIPSSTDYRLPLQTEKPVVMGPQTAIVTGPKSEEVAGSDFASVKVQFHWDRKGTRDESSSCFVRVAQQWAGSGWGSFFLPRIGQEVVVDFLEGDPDRPLITGSVYNGFNKPPHSKGSISGVKSHSTKQGGPHESNEIRFDDTKGEEQLFVHAQRNYKQVVEKDRKAEIHGDDAVEVGGSHSLKGSKTVKISAPLSIKLECGETASLSIEPQMVTLRLGSAILTIDPSGITMVPSAKVGNRPI